MNTATHPTELVLLRLADGEPTNEAALADARRHLEQCADCRAIVRHNSELFRRARTDSPAHTAGDELFARIQHSRAMGTRVILPDADGPVQGYAYATIAPNDGANDGNDEAIRDDASRLETADRSGAVVRRANSHVDTERPSRFATFAVAASLMVVAFGTWRVIARPAAGAVAASGVGVDSSSRAADVRSNAEAGASRAPSPEQSLLQSLSPWPTMAYAQTRAPGRPAPYPPLSGLDASRLREGRRWYLRSSANDYHDMLPHTLTSVETARVRWKNKPAWRVVTREPMRDKLDMVDTLVLMDSTLLPVFRRTNTGFMEVREEYADSVVTETFTMRPPPELDTTSKIGKSMAATLRAIKPMITTHRIDRRRITPLGDHAMRVLLQAIPLTATWRSSVGVFIRTLNTREQLRPASDGNYLNLRVDGIDTLQVFNGRIEVWRVLLETGPTPEVWYVSRETGETILTEGAWGREYPKSTNMLMGWHETKRLPPVRIR